ncbi:MAG: sigma factor-like helix-turn-helix DNA-binding protein [Chloroflexota bacterium]
MKAIKHARTVQVLRRIAAGEPTADGYDQLVDLLLTLPRQKANFLLEVIWREAPSVAASEQACGVLSGSGATILAAARRACRKAIPSSDAGWPVPDDEAEVADQMIESVVKTERLSALGTQIRTRLPRRERAVLALRFGFVDGNVHTFKDIGRCVGVSASMVPTIELRALRRLRWAVLERPSEERAPANKIETFWLRESRIGNRRQVASRRDGPTAAETSSARAYEWRSVAPFLTGMEPARPKRAFVQTTAVTLIDGLFAAVKWLGRRKSKGG